MNNKKILRTSSDLKRSLRPGMKLITRDNRVGLLKREKSKTYIKFSDDSCYDLSNYMENMLDLDYNHSNYDIMSIYESHPALLENVFFMRLEMPDFLIELLQNLLIKGIESIEINKKTEEPTLILTLKDKDGKNKISFQGESALFPELNKIPDGEYFLENLIAN